MKVSPAARVILGQLVQRVPQAVPVLQDSLAASGRKEIAGQAVFPVVRALLGLRERRATAVLLEMKAFPVQKARSEMLAVPAEMDGPAEKENAVQQVPWDPRVNRVCQEPASRANLGSLAVLGEMVCPERRVFVVSLDVEARTVTAANRAVSARPGKTPE